MGIRNLFKKKSEEGYHREKTRIFPYSNVEELGDDALIIQQRNEADVTPKEHRANMSTEERRKYFWFYHLKPIIAITCILAFVTFLALHTYYADQAMLRIVVMNEVFENDVKENFTDSFLQAVGKEPGSENISFSEYSSWDSNIGSPGEDLDTFKRRFHAGKVDVLICEGGTLADCQKLQGIEPMENILTKEEMAKLKDKLYIPTEKVYPKPVAYGIYLDTCSAYQKLYPDQASKAYDHPILSVPSNAHNKENAKKFVHYLFSDQLK